MLSQCANPTCAKPLHYLREGRIFVFDLPERDAPKSTSGKGAHRLRHFWLCGRCSLTMVMEQNTEMEVRVVSKVKVAKRDLVPGLLSA